MGKQKITIQDLKCIHFPTEVARSLALNIMNRHFKHSSIEVKLNLIRHVLANPTEYINHETLSLLAYKLISKINTTSACDVFDLEPEPRHFDVFGNKHIEANARRQMELVMRLPVVRRGALMPDAHQGYGMPVGGVVATTNAVIPYGVGMDIGCRMALSVLDIPVSYITREVYKLKKALQENTHFGNEGVPDIRSDHPILESTDFRATDLLQKLQGKAARQLGTSGSGNHFVEFGVLTLDVNNIFGIAPGEYTALLSHSGSRGLGAAIAQHYTAVAMDKCKLPAEAKHLAWLELDSSAGAEYWHAMNLAGEYARACHEVIHKKLCADLGAEAILQVENHHNFAWREMIGGEQYIVHRKGATPAAKGQAGIIPGSMTTPGYLVSGTGNETALNSAAHGAGRRFSRQRARDSVTMSALKKQVAASGVTLIGGSAEEAPGAYKDIDLIMKSQTMQVKIEGKFYPRVVRMDK